jgi:hypothetical protein
VPRKRSVRKEIFALGCSIIVVLLSAVPMFDRNNDAQVLVLFFGAFAAGMSFARLLAKLRTGNE